MWVFQNRVLRRLFGPKTDKIMGSWRKCIIMSFSSPNIIRIIKLRRMQWARHLACMGEKRMHGGFWWENLTEKDH
jgi:hypothetical protein